MQAISPAYRSFESERNGKSRDEIDATSNYGPVATLFDVELEKALLATKERNPDLVDKIVSDYVALQKHRPFKRKPQRLCRGLYGG